MQHQYGKQAFNVLLSLTACACAFGATQAYANETRLISDDGESRIWVYEKTAVSNEAPLIRIDQTLPQLVVPLNTSFEATSDQAQNEAPIMISPVEWTKPVSRDFDLVEDNPLFIGAPEPSEFDQLEALRESGAYPETLEVEPFFTVAGAGIETSF